MDGREQHHHHSMSIKQQIAEAVFASHHVKPMVIVGAEDFRDLMDEVDPNTIYPVNPATHVATLQIAHATCVAAPYLVRGFLIGSQEEIVKLHILMDENERMKADPGRDHLKRLVDSLVQTVAHNMFHDTVRACAEHWGHMKDGRMDKNTWPPIRETNTMMKDGTDRVEKNFTKALSR
jgi:hypothetical protein